jgi:hypothetical protein
VPAGAKFYKDERFLLPASVVYLTTSSASEHITRSQRHPQASVRIISVDNDSYSRKIAMAEYRNLAPSTQNEYSSASSAYNTSGGLGTPSTLGTSSGGAGGSNNGSGSGSGEGQQRRRRAAGQVSVLACTECRRARARVSDIGATVMSLWARTSHFSASRWSTETFD